MAATIKLKRGTSTPSTSDIASGEVAIDTSAQKLYINDSGTVKEIGGGGGGGVTSDSDENTIAGTQAGDSITSGSGTDNTVYGYDAGTAITTADNCIAIGHSALLTNETQSSQVAVGKEAGKVFNSGSDNTWIGTYTARSSATQNYVTVLGARVLQNRSASMTGITAVGYTAMQWGDGDYSTAIGAQALLMNQAVGNTGLGYQAGYAVTTGTDNTCVGTSAGDAVTTGANNLILGHDAAASAATVSNEITLGDTNITKFRIPGLGFEVASSGAATAVGYECPATVSADWSIGANNNAMFPGPMTVASSVTVTVPTDRTLTIV